MDVPIEFEDASNELHGRTEDVVEETCISAWQGHGSDSDEGADYIMEIPQVARVWGIGKHTEEGARCGRGFLGNEFAEHGIRIGQGRDGASDEGVHDTIGIVGVGRFVDIGLHTDEGAGDTVVEELDDGCASFTSEGVVEGGGAAGGGLSLAREFLSLHPSLF